MSLILPIPKPAFPYDPEMEDLYREAFALTKWSPERIPKAIDKVLDGELGVKVAPSLPKRNIVERKLAGKLRGVIQRRNSDEKELANTFAEVVQIFANQLKAS